MNATPQLLLQGGAMDLPQFIDFVRHRGLAVIAARGADGAPQAALVGIVATGRAELVFDTSRSSRKYRNLSAFAQVAMVIGWDNEITVQCEGIADIAMAPTTIAVLTRKRWSDEMVAAIDRRVSQAMRSRRLRETIVYLSSAITSSACEGHRGGPGVTSG